jgi:hypothetical protein
MSEENLIIASEIMREPPVPTGEQVESIERLMRERPQVPIETTHHFAGGVYAREILVPKGVLATGKVHLTEHLVIIPKGDLSILVEGGVKRIVGPATFVVKPGMKHIGYAHEDTIFICIHACKATEPDEAERELVVETLEEYRALTSGKENSWPSLPQQL